MLNSITNLPHEFSLFWNAGAGYQIQIVFFLVLLYLFGYYSSKLLINRNIWKWLILFFLAGPFLIQIYFSKQIIIIFPVALGLCKGLFIGNAGFNPLGAFEGLTDIFLSIRQRRGHAAIKQKYEEAEEVLKKAQQYSESQQRSQNEYSSNSRKDFNKEQFREEMRRQRATDNEYAKPDENTASKNSSEGKHKKQEKVEPREKQTSSDADNRTPQQILGLSTAFTQSELKKARNDALKRCHSDKWVDKPKAMQQVMEEETKKVNWAYEKLI